MQLAARPGMAWRRVRASCDAISATAATMRWHVLVVWAVALAATASARSLQRPRLTAATARPDASPNLFALRGGLAATDDGSPLLLLLRAWECRDDPEHLRVLCDRLAFSKAHCVPRVCS